MKLLHRIRSVQRYSWTLVALALTFSAAFIALGRFYYVSQTTSVRRNATATLASIADLKARQIAGWYQERLIDAEMLLDPLVIADEIAEFRAQPAAPNRRTELLTWMQRVQKRYDFASVHLYDEKGRRLLSVPDEPLPPSTHVVDHIQNALRSRKVVPTDLHVGAQNRKIHLTLTAPVLARAGGDQAPLGAFQFLIDPARFLFPLVRGWPTPSRTAETLLLRREGDELVYLSDLRDRPNSALTLRVPLSKSATLASAMAAQQEQGVLVGTDYRNQSVLMALRTIAGTPWFMVAKVDLAEADAPLTELAWTTAAMVAVLIAAAFLGVGLLWRHRTVLAVRERENIFRALFDDAPVGYHELDASGRLVRVNRTELDLLGYAEQDMLGRSVSEFTEDLTAEVPALQAGQPPAPRVSECRFRRQDGSLLPVLVSSRLLQTDDGAIVGLRSSLQDLTDRKRAETALRESEERYHTLFDHAGDAIVIHNGVGQVLAVNARACEQYGYTEPEMLSLTVDRIDTPEEAVHAPARIAHLLKHGEHKFETVHRRKDGAPVPVEVTARRIAWNRQSAVMSICRDITERKRSEMILRRSEARYRALFSQSGDHILVLAVQPSGPPIIVELNEAAVRAHGYTQEEMIGRSITLIDPDVTDEVEAERSRLTREQAEAVFEVRHRRKDGSIFDVEVRAKQLEIDGQRVILSIERDITERRRSANSRSRSARRNSIPSSWRWPPMVSGCWTGSL